MTFRNRKTQPKPEKAFDLKFAARGWAVLALHTIRDGHCSCTDGPNCAHPGKHPLTSRGVKDATNSKTEIEAWRNKWPDANIGIATGSGLTFSSSMSTVRSARQVCEI